MKIKHFLLAALAVVALSSCQKDEILPEKDLQGDGGYLILTLDNPTFSKVNGASSSRTSGSAVDNGTEQENKISSITVVLTDLFGNISFVANPSISNGKTEKIKVALGYHYVYALANNPVTVSVGQNINQVFSLLAAMDGFKNGSLLMTNQRNSSGEQAGVLALVTKENSVTNPSRVTINVDHTACKILDETTAPIITNLVFLTSNMLDDVEVEGFSVLNVNKEFNLIQTWNTNNSTGISLNSEVLSTPFSSTNLVADQYIYNIGAYTTLAKDDDENIIGVTDNTIGRTDFFNKAPVYVPENRPTIFAFGSDGITAGRGEATGVIYKVQAKKGGNKLGTFYKYKNVLLSQSLADIQALPDFTEDLSSLSIPELRARDIKVYENGVMYYSYFICDSNEAHQYDGKNYYAVFRNTSYKLKINSISQLGDDVPGGIIVDPTMPGETGNPNLDTQDAHLEVSVVVNPWILNIVDIEF